MNTDEIIIKTFTENQAICFPIHCQREAKCFIKILFKNGLNGIIFSEEIGESEATFTSWKNGLSKIGVGKKVMKRINKPIEDFLWSDGELSELERELKKEVDKIKCMKNRKTKINRRIELGRSPTTKTLSEKNSKKEKRMKLQEKMANHCSFDVSLKNIPSSVKSADASKCEEKFLSSRTFQRGISCPGPDKETNQEFVEDFKTIKLRKTGRTDLFESDPITVDRSKVEFEVCKMDGKSKNIDRIECNDSRNIEIEHDESAIRVVIHSDEPNDFNAKNNCCAYDECCYDLSEEFEINKESEKSSNCDFQTDQIVSVDDNEQVDDEIDEKMTLSHEQVKTGFGDNPVDYLYVFTDSNSCNSSPVKSHRFKIGVASCPYEELKKASEFNVDIKLISATAVKNPQQAMERVQEELQLFLMKGRDSWYYCSLSKVLQTTSEAVSWASNSSQRK